MFEKASQMKLRFESSVGSLSVEDLWDLPLTSKSKTSLDSLAIAINRDLQSSKEDSFVATKSKGNAVLELKLEILKHVIANRLAANEAAKTAGERKLRKDKLVGILAAKQDEALTEMSVEDLQKEIEAVG